MTPAELSLTVRGAVRRAVEAGPLRGVTVPERVRVERPRPGGSGDWATNAALTLAGQAGRAPREVAEILREHIGSGPADGIALIEITGPGFLNFTLSDGTGADLVRTVLNAGPRHGHGSALAGTTAVFARAPEPRARVWTETVVALLRSQGADASVAPQGMDRVDGMDGVETVRVVPAPPEDDLFARLGRDAARWALLRPAPHDRPRTGPELLIQRESNPLFRVRYAHARTHALARNAAHLGITPAPAGEAPAPQAAGRPAALTHDPAAAGLLAVLGDHSAVLEAAARLRAPDRLARHLEQTAEAFLRFQETGRLLPLGDEKPSAAHRSRLALAAATGAVLAGGLSLLGIDAPEHL
ncbi:ArgS-related anticodon-binding protein NrtL [Streptomyces sp. NPDC088725]|uniref:ArgS-related anticodon-binding protein NrtL n=1 Tax=Streptomyces sp. NPDC088725 TaxID=3365873 RepID=UPI0037F90B75